MLRITIILYTVRTKAKTRNRCNQGPHLTQDTAWESDKTQEKITYKRAKRSAFSQKVTTRMQETDMTVCQRQTQIKKIHKINTTLDWYIRKLLEGLNQFHGTNLTLNCDVDQDTYMFSLHERSLTYQ